MLAITNPQTGLIVGIIVSLVCEWLLSREWGAKKTDAAEPVEELPQNTGE